MRPSRSPRPRRPRPRGRRPARGSAPRPGRATPRRRPARSPREFPARASTSAGDPSCTNSNGGPHSGLAEIAVSSPSKRTLTSPAGGRSTAGSKPRSRSSQALPTSGWPASGSSTSGVKMRSAARSRSSTNTVSAKPRSRATSWRRGSGICEPSRKTPSGLPPLPSAAQKTRRTSRSQRPRSPPKPTARGWVRELSAASKLALSPVPEPPVIERPGSANQLAGRSRHRRQDHGVHGHLSRKAHVLEAR